MFTANGMNVIRRDVKKGDIEYFENGSNTNTTITSSSSSINNNDDSRQNINGDNSSSGNNSSDGCFKKALMSFCGSSKKWIVLRFGMIFLISVVILCCVYGLKSTSKHKNSSK